jgi:hypothetical protein
MQLRGVSFEGDDSESMMDWINAFEAVGVKLLENWAPPPDEPTLASMSASARAKRATADELEVEGAPTTFDPRITIGGGDVDDDSDDLHALTNDYDDDAPPASKVPSYKSSTTSSSSSSSASAMLPGERKKVNLLSVLASSSSNASSSSAGASASALPALTASDHEMAKIALDLPAGQVTEYRSRLALSHTL